MGYVNYQPQLFDAVRHHWTTKQHCERFQAPKVPILLRPPTSIRFFHIFARRCGSGRCALLQLAAADVCCFDSKTLMVYGGPPKDFNLDCLMVILCRTLDPKIGSRSSKSPGKVWVTGSLVLIRPIADVTKLPSKFHHENMKFALHGNLRSQWSITMWDRTSMVTGGGLCPLPRCSLDDNGCGPRHGGAAPEAMDRVSPSVTMA